MCRERLRKILLSGRKAECAFMRCVGLLVTGILFAAIAGWLSEDFAFSLAPEPLERLFFARERTVRDLSASVSEETDASSLAESYEQSLELTLKRGDTLFELLVKEGIPRASVHELVQACRLVFDVKRLPQGRTIAVVYDGRDGQVQRFESLADEDHLLLVERTADGLMARKEAFAYEIRPRRISGAIRGSLFGAAEQAGLPPSLIMSLAEIFDYDIDFHVDLKAGDTFQVLVEEKYLDGNLVRMGRILAARMTSQGRPFWAFRFQGKEGRAEFYDREGRSLRKTFLRSPLKYTRISSGFSPGRFHPILQIHRPHLGVDYAAPSGTPVRAVSDGKVTYVGWEGGFGNYVKIQHNGTFTSTYGHLLHFGNGVRTGGTVRQGQVIGYVGATGLATGPHLDFRLLKNGQFINPLKINAINAEPVDREEMAAFRTLVGQRVAELEQGGPTLANDARVPRGL